MEVIKTTLFGLGEPREMPQYFEENSDVLNMVSYYIQNTKTDAANVQLIEYNEEPYQSIVLYVECDKKMLRWMETFVTIKNGDFHSIDIFNDKDKFNQFCDEHASEMV